MKPHVFVVMFLLSIFQSSLVQASNDPERLIQSCQELVGIYNKRGEKHLAAGLTTSLSEALRAGYCMGVVDEYRRNTRCYVDGWYSQAKKIAEYPLSFAKRTSVEELLGISCDI